VLRVPSALREPVISIATDATTATAARTSTTTTTTAATATSTTTSATTTTSTTTIIISTTTAAGIVGRGRLGDAAPRLAVPVTTLMHRCDTGLGPTQRCVPEPCRIMRHSAAEDRGCREDHRIDGGARPSAVAHQLVAVPSLSAYDMPGTSRRYVMTASRYIVRMRV
jgi:hypothetical protein